jgi:Flp pilus assembly protein TadD
MRYRNCFLATLASLLVTATCAQEQLAPIPPSSGAGNLRCVVEDSHGRPLSDIPIELHIITPPIERVRATTSADGFVSIEYLRTGTWELTAAGGILLPSKHVQVGTDSTTTITLRLPVTLGNAPGYGGQTVSVQQLGVPERVRETIYRAYDAWMHNDLRQSRALAMRALEMKPDYGPAMSLLGILELQEGHPEEAIAGLLGALRYNPDSVRSYIALASAYNQLRKNSEALDALAIARNLSPDSWQVRYETGRAYLGMGQFQRAMTEFDRSAEVGATEAVVLHVGKAHALLGLRDYAKAKAEFDIVLQKDPKGPYAEESRNLVQLLDAKLKRIAPSEPIVQAASATR